MEYDSRKQKRSGLAAVESFEESFDNASSTATPELSRQDTVVDQHISSDCDKQNMDAEMSVTKFIESSTSSSRLHQYDHNTNNSGEKSRKQSLSYQASASPNVNLQMSLSGNGDTTIYSGITSLAVNLPKTPRIDISRASSSSHHDDSRDSSPDNVFEQVGTGTLQESIGLFREDGAMDLRTSTEELYFMDPDQMREEQEKIQQANKSPVIFKFDEHQTYLQQHQRKDSASSEVAALLCISGRTSRISSVGSQGSAVSRLSAISGISRSPSPHKMLLETSFCGPKPLENTVDGNISNVEELPTAEVLEQVLLSRKHDPTQAVFAEGIKIEQSPIKILTNGDAKRKTSDRKEESKTINSTTGARTLGKKVAIPTVAAIKRNGKQHMKVVGSLPSGAEYIRINLKPDYLYEDKGVAPNERVIETAKGKPGTSDRKKPITLSLGHGANIIEQGLTGGSRSPSPSATTISRKSSFCSLFKTKDSPDSPRDQSRSRSKSREKPTLQPQSGTPNKQKSVLAIFKPRRSVSKSKCSSPIDHEAMITSIEGISQVEFKFKSDSCSGDTENRSRSSSRLRYYDTPTDGKSIHIPLHTPTEDKQDRTFSPVMTEGKEPEPLPIFTSSSGCSQLTTEPTSVSSATLPSMVLGEFSSCQKQEKAPALPQKAPKSAQFEKTQRIVNLDAIQNIVTNEKSECERTWSLEVHRCSSQDSQEIVNIDSLNSTCAQERASKPNLPDIVEKRSMESEKTANPQKQQEEINESINHQSIPTTIEKKRILFSTKIGSGSQEQVFITQFSISKTESLSSQLSEQQSIPGSPNFDKSLHRTDTVIRRIDDSQGASCDRQINSVVSTLKHKISTEEEKQTSAIAVIAKNDERKRNSSDNEDKRPMSAVVVMRKREQTAETKRKSVSEEDDSTNRHSRYIESFDVKKGIADLKRQSRCSSDSSIKERDSRTSSREDQDTNTPLAAPKLPPKIPTSYSGKSERQSAMSTTDDLVESSESERESVTDPNRIKRHLPRHIGAVEDHESTGLVSQDSFEDDLPFVPTTLPEERAFGVSLIPIKDRAYMGVKTCSVDRPRSTTPLNPACLEEYCGIIVTDDTENAPIRGGKLRISLPTKDLTKERSQRTKSPRRASNTSGKTWFEFAEHGMGQITTTTASVTTPTQLMISNQQEEEIPPPLPPRKPTAPFGQWVDFENIPEKRKPPKRITALPKDSSMDFLTRTPNAVQYNYVKPEECQCECHGGERESHTSIINVDLLQQGEDLQPLLDTDSHEGIEPSDSSVEYNYDQEGRPFQIDLPIEPLERSFTIESADPPEVRLIHSENTPKRSTRSSIRNNSVEYTIP